MANTAAHAFLSVLAAHGVDRIFQVPGESYIGLLDAVADFPQIDLVTCRHEAGAGFMACADGRLTRRPGVVRTYAVAAVLISANWYLFIWGVGHNRVVETSLGYFINPLVSVALGVLLFHERLRTLQWIAIALAAAGVLYLAFDYGRLPWLALSLAVTFALYGAVKKQAPLNPEHGLTLETSMLALPAFAFLALMDYNGLGAWGHRDFATTAFLTGGGLVTTIPLLLFAAAMPTLRLSTAGILQYVMPTLQFLSGVLVYGEPFTPSQRIGFGAVWAGCLLFAIDVSARREPSAPRRNP